jgi:hypothetical protein
MGTADIRHQSPLYSQESGQLLANSAVPGGGVRDTIVVAEFAFMYRPILPFVGWLAANLNRVTGANSNEVPYREVTVL